MGGDRVVWFWSLMRRAFGGDFGGFLFLVEMDSLESDRNRVFFCGFARKIELNASVFVLAASRLWAVFSRGRLGIAGDISLVRQ
jgi:hypothetical protein